jgi:hypothetical protein
LPYVRRAGPVLEKARLRDLRRRPATLDGVRIDGGFLSATLAPASWNVIRVSAKAAV